MSVSMSNNNAESWNMFGNWLKTQRVNRRMKKTEVAKAAGVSFSTWVSLEAGGRTMAGRWVLPNPTPVTLASIAKALGVEQREVFFRAGMDPDWDKGHTSLEEMIAAKQAEIETLLSEINTLKALKSQ